MDGTLLDSMGIWEEVGEIYLNRRGIEAKPGLNDAIINMRLIDGARLLIDDYGLSSSAEEICEEFKDIVQQYYNNDAPIKPGVYEFLDELKRRGVGMCLATATNRNMVEPALKRLGLIDYFSEIFTTKEVGKHKGFPDIYRIALEHLGTDRSNTLVFEDALYAAKTAKDDGFFVAGISDRYCRELADVKGLSDVYIDSYLELDEFWRFADSM